MAGRPKSIRNCADPDPQHCLVYKEIEMNLDFAIKMTDVADDGVVFHLKEVLSYDDVFAA